MASNFCVMCGREIPDGAHVCTLCMKENQQQERETSGDMLFDTRVKILSNRNPVLKLLLYVSRNIVFLPVARYGYHGLFIKIQCVHDRWFQKPENWENSLIQQGYAYEISKDWDDAASILTQYI